MEGPSGLTYTKVPPGGPDKTEFLMLKNGRVAFEGSADELHASDDEYLKAFLS